MNNNLDGFAFFLRPSLYSSLSSGQIEESRLWVASVNGTDCLTDAHPFLKHTKKKIQVRPSCLLPGALDVGVFLCGGAVDVWIFVFMGRAGQRGGGV